MPIYEYRRPDGTTFELQQSFSEEALTVDPNSGVPVERVLHPPALHFKGNGFYSTDYGSRNRERETAASAASAKDSSSNSSTGSSGEGSSGEGSSSGGDSQRSSADGKGKGKNETAVDAPAKSANSKPVATKS
jgi:predicted nucleic acid-binding Zn ribbon protein